METVKTESRITKRIASQVYYVPLSVNESISEFFNSVDSVVCLAGTKLLLYQISRLGLFRAEHKAELDAVSGSSSDSNTAALSTSALASPAPPPVVAALDP